MSGQTVSRDPNSILGCLERGRSSDEKMMVLEVMAPDTAQVIRSVERACADFASDGFHVPASAILTAMIEKAFPSEQWPRMTTELFSVAEVYGLPMENPKGLVVVWDGAGFRPARVH